MNADTLISALELPSGSRVEQRVPKKLMLENGAPTAADKRHINEGIVELLWLAALKPTTIGVPEYRDEVREYLEIAVLRLTLRGAAKVTRLVELVHRAVPYPLLLLTEQDERPGLSAAHKRWSQGEAGETVLEGDILTVEWNAEHDGERWCRFRDALALGKQPRTTLHALYQGWIDTLLALQAARLTGTFAVAANAERAAIRRDALKECARLDAEIARLRATAAKEKQMARRVELNLELKRVEAAHAAARANLKHEDTMQKLTANDPETKSPDIVAENVSRLRALFPELVTEGPEGVAVNLDVLKQLVGDQTVTDVEEKYGLNWHGKRRARRLALTPSTGTLRPCPEDSVGWDTTKNLMIEGDNLEVLKLLQKSYAGKVKIIYIDPPYNTGKDFVYPDNFQDSIKNYLELTGQAEGGRKVSSNTEVSGRFHTDWLNMMYPRLKLARNLLREDGSIFISIDDGELDNIRKLCSEVFGEENFVVQIIWKKRNTPPNDQIIGANHDYIVCYARNAAAVNLQLRERSEDQLERYRNPDNHPKGPWAPGDLMANVKGGRFVKSLFFAIVNPTTHEEHYPGTNGNWRFSPETIARLQANNEIYFGEDGRGKPKLKRFLCDVKEGVTYASIWDFVPLNTSGSSEMGEIFDNPTIFESPKPVGLIRELVKLGTTPDAIVMDFFAGSGTTGHAVVAQNVADGGTRRYLLVQLPEPTPPDSEASKARYATIADLTKERLRRVGKKIHEETPMFSGDLGFRVFKLASSNIQAWEPDREKLVETLEASIEHLKTDRTEQDILFELLLKLGLDLCVPIERKKVEGGMKKTHEIHSIGGGSLLVCLSLAIPQGDVEPLALGLVAWHKALKPAGETTVVFRDSAFADDVAKTNLTAILHQRGLETVRSL